MKQPLLRILLTVVAIIALFFSYRAVFCPKLVIANGFAPSADVVNALERKLKGNILDNTELAEELKGKKIILVGETHFQEQIMGYFTDLLGKIYDKKIVLNLELPQSMQEPLDLYMETGNEKYLSKFRDCSECLPYYNIIKWCREHRNRIEKVFAVDENRYRIFLMRCLRYDTRNKTMARNVLESHRKYPNSLIIFYGGQLHCLLNGRYLYNVENRTPVGKLLLRSGINRKDISSILLDYNNNFPTSLAWKDSIGAARIKNQLGNLSLNFFVRDTVFDVTQAQEAFDYYVNIGNISGSD